MSILLFRFCTKFRNFCTSSKSVKISPLPDISPSGTSTVSSTVKDFCFWAFISYSSANLFNIPVPSKPKDSKPAEDLPFWRNINLGEDKYKYGLMVASLLMGYGILSISWMYTLRSVRMLVLRKDRSTVCFVTYAPFGKDRVVDVPMNHISALSSRNSGSSQIAVRVKNTRMFYIVDMKGQIANAPLFDRTVGTLRNF